MALKQNSIGTRKSASDSWWLCGVLALAVMWSLAGCTQDAADSVQEGLKKTGEAVKETAEDTKEAVGEGVEEAGKMAEESIEKLSEGFSAAGEKASQALESVDGGGELLTKVKSFFASAQETIAGITDKDSAEAAVSKLGDLEGMADGLSKSIGELPDEAKAAVGGLMASGTAMLKAMIEKIQAMPGGVSEVVKPKLEALMEKLESFSDE